MGHDDSTKRPKLSHPVPPATADFDDSWEDEVLGEDRQTLLVVGEEDEACDRITAVPDLPSEQYVALIMSQAEETDQQASGDGPKIDPAAPKSVPEAAPDPLPNTGTPPMAGAPRAPETALDSGTANSGGRVGLVPLELDDLEFGLADDLDTATAFTLPPLSSDSPPPGSVPSSDVVKAVGAPRLEMQDRYAIGDFTGALAVAERLLELDASDAEADRYARSCRNVLTEMYTARMGSLSQLITVAVPPTQVRWLSLDHRAGFVLSLIDNASTVEEVLDISGMPPLDTLRILTELLEQGVIVVSPS